MLAHLLDTRGNIVISIQALVDWLLQRAAAPVMPVVSSKEDQSSMADLVRLLGDPSKD